jgi:acyl-CoA thioesterase II
MDSRNVTRGSINFGVHSITVAADTLKLKRFSKGPDSIAMSSTLDHSIWYYDDNFRCEDGLLYVVVCPRAEDGRGVVHGRLYGRGGTLVAVTCQEGVVRANRRGGDVAKL